MRSLAALLVVVVVVAAGAVVFLRSRPTTTATSRAEPPSAAPSPGPSTAPSPTAGTTAKPRTLPETSEALIAGALKAGEINYEQSLLARAYALFDDPRLPKEFRSPVIDWEAAMALAVEIGEKESTLSTEILTQLAPFRARPNDPASIFNRPRQEVLKTQSRSAAGWAKRRVSGTNVMIWIEGAESQLDRFEPMVTAVWAAFPKVFPYPDSDETPATPINPDTAIDIYFMKGGEIDPRSDECGRQNPDPIRCPLGAHGVTWPTKKGITSSSAYCLVNYNYPDDEVRETIAHELAHATQMKYDYHEFDFEASKWVTEGSAQWVAHQVVKELQKRPPLSYEALFNTNGLGMFQNTEQALDERFLWYGRWLFFFYASMEAGDGIVTTIWEYAGHGLTATEAVNKAVPFDYHFPRFAVRNWNKDPVAKRYETADRTFPTGLKPYEIKNYDDPPRIVELSGPVEPVPRLASAYFTFTFPDRVRRITLQNFYHDVDDAHLWAMWKTGSDWHGPEDWSKVERQMFCRDATGEDVSELVLVLSNSNMKDTLPKGHPKPRVISEENGCPVLSGWAQTTVRFVDASQNVTFGSDKVKLEFKPRAIQDPDTENTEYDLMPTVVMWSASGRRGDCTLSGSVAINVGGPMQSGSTTTGYMNVVKHDGGDFHSIIIMAMDTNKFIRRTCPGPKVLRDVVNAGIFMQILSEPNRVENRVAVYKGTKTINFGDPAVIVPPSVAKMPEVANALKNMQKSTKEYVFNWELRPKAAAAHP